MGIPYYIASLLRQHKHIRRNIPTTTDILAIDFNCFIHKYLNADNPMGSLMVAFDDLLKTIPARQVYVAFDGLVPIAKMVQQRYRRMKKQEPSGFDKHQISPGTPFMRELADTLRFLFPNVVVSDTLERGEGEHKIFTWLRHQTRRDHVCIYGLDADLVLIALAQSHLATLEIVRENDKEPGFHAISISALKDVLPMDLDTYIRMCILSFGNDFMPNLAMFSLREDGYSRAVYYATRDDASKDETKLLVKRGERHRHIVAPDGHALEQRIACQLMDGVLNWEPVVTAFWKTLEWTLHYFKTSEVLDWHWYYPYPEAPLVQTLDEFPVSTEFVWDHPEPLYTIDDQLKFILPETSLKAVGLSPAYPDELYEEDKHSRHPWMRRFAWECDPYVSLPIGQLTRIDEFVLPEL